MAAPESSLAPRWPSPCVEFCFNKQVVPEKVTEPEAELGIPPLTFSRLWYVFEVEGKHALGGGLCGDISIPWGHIEWTLLNQERGVV